MSPLIFGRTKTDESIQESEGTQDEPINVSSAVTNPVTRRPRKLNRHRQTKQRRQAIIALIKSKPSGTPIKTSEFVAVTHMSESVTYNLISAMVEQGAISKRAIGLRKTAYRVNGSTDTPKLLPPRKSRQPCRKTRHRSNSQRCQSLSSHLLRPCCNWPKIFTGKPTATICTRLWSG